MRTTTALRSRLLSVSVMTVASLLMTPTAMATTPGDNGRIVYSAHHGQVSSPDLARVLSPQSKPTRV